MQRVAVSTDDLTGGTGSRAELLRRAIRVGAGGRVDVARLGSGRIGPGPEYVIVPPSAEGGSSVARRNIGCDHLRGGAFQKQNIVRARRLVERIENFHIATLDRELATKRPNAVVTGVQKARQTTTREKTDRSAICAGGACEAVRRASEIVAEGIIPIAQELAEHAAARSARID